MEARMISKQNSIYLSFIWS